MLRGAERVCCAGRSAFGRRAEPERSEGGWSEAQRSGAKWRGRGLGQRNISIKYYCKIKNNITNSLYFYAQREREREE